MQQSFGKKKNHTTSQVIPLILGNFHAKMTNNIMKIMHDDDTPQKMLLT